ncbi:MAG: hypothetical protein ACYDAD_14480 [Acidimicrobiales bacterium]
MMSAEQAGGECLRIPERLVVAPTVGVFRPLPPETCTSEGEIIAEGQVLGVIECPGNRVPVLSSFCGFFMGMLAVEGERVRAGQPVAWLRAL